MRFKNGNNMSLVATWVRAKDGKYYKEPSWRGIGNDGRESWFVCVDDDEPVELVVRRGFDIPEFDWLMVISENTACGSRTFGKEGDDKVRFFGADAYWCEFVAPAEIPDNFEEVYDPSGGEPRPYMGVFYDTLEE